MTHDHEDPPAQFVKEVRATQSNSLWPDVLRNNRSVDEVMWKGDPAAPLVQRTGLIVWAVFLIATGLATIDIGYHQRASFEFLIALFCFSLAARLLLNAFRRK